MNRHAGQVLSLSLLLFDKQLMAVELLNRPAQLFSSPKDRPTASVHPSKPGPEGDGERATQDHSLQSIQQWKLVQVVSLDLAVGTLNFRSWSALSLSHTTIAA